MNPYVILAGVLLFVGACGFSYYKGGENKENQIAAERLKEKSFEERLQISLAGEIAKIRITNRTIQEKVEVITREVPVYTDCRNDPAVLRLLNDALSGRVEADAVDDSVVPGDVPAPAR